MAKQPTRQRPTPRRSPKKRAVDPFDRTHLTDPAVRAVVRELVDAILAETSVKRAAG